MYEYLTLFLKMSITSISYKGFIKYKKDRDNGLVKVSSWDGYADGAKFYDACFHGIPYSIEVEEVASSCYPEENEFLDFINSIFNILGEKGYKLVSKNVISRKSLKSSDDNGYNWFSAKEINSDKYKLYDSEMITTIEALVFIKQREEKRTSKKAERKKK